MASMTDYLENKLADHLFRTTTYSQPSTLYIGLYTAAPSDTGGGTEVSGNAYARVACNPSNSNWTGTHGNTTGASSGTGGQVTNAADVTFPTPTPSGWGTVTHFGIFDASTSGNLLFHAALTSSKTINAGDTVKFSAGQLTVTFA